MQRIAYLLLIACLIASCRAPVQPKPALTNIATMECCEPVTFHPCFQTVQRAMAWIDGNANGLWDADEQPLSWVQFQVKQAENVASAVSDGSGEAEVVLEYECTDVREELGDQSTIEPYTPSGYHPIEPDIPPGFAALPLRFLAPEKPGSD